MTHDQLQTWFQTNAARIRREEIAGQMLEALELARDHLKPTTDSVEAWAAYSIVCHVCDQAKLPPALVEADEPDVVYD